MNNSAQCSHPKNLPPQAERSCQEAAVVWVMGVMFLWAGEVPKTSQCSRLPQGISVSLVHSGSCEHARCLLYCPDLVPMVMYSEQLFVAWATSQSILDNKCLIWRTFNHQ